MALTQARVNAAIDAALATADYVQLHDGDPGVNGTDNIAGEVAGRVAISFPGATSAESEATVSFAITSGGGPYNFISLWSASSAGTHQGNAALSPAETFAGAGSLDVTVTVAGSSS